MHPFSKLDRQKSSTVPLRIGLAGMGHLGKYHFEKIMLLAQEGLVTPIGIIEPFKENAKQAIKVGIPVYATWAQSNWEHDSLDALVIASPTPTHHTLAIAALSYGIHVLIEKPITTIKAQAEEIKEQAETSGCIVQVGHVERFNPAIEAATPLINSPMYISAERLSPFSGRSSETDVLFDLMIHDIDLVSSWINSPLKEVRAIGVPILTNETDMAAVRLEFENGAVAQLSAGRASLEPSRKIRVFTKERYISIDCAKREVKSVKKTPASDAQTWPTIEGEPIVVRNHDPLEMQLRSFIQSIRTGAPPRVDAGVALRSVHCIAEIQRYLQENELQRESHA